MICKALTWPEIRNARGNVREAIAALQAAGRLRKTKSWLTAQPRHLVICW
ncbi:internal head protein [Escherichia coli]|uniref:Internal head protein n=1 Tax=Escherichia coli TaxID=562 RepID=A0A376YKL6_ECOLX|nr:internal head protein [Escherichia coli]